MKYQIDHNDGNESFSSNENEQITYFNNDEQ